MSKKIQILLAAFLCQLTACNQSGTIIEEVNYVGYAQGTTFQIKYLVPKGSDYSLSIDSVFKAVDVSVNTYDSTSLISKINKGDTLMKVDAIFSTLLERSFKLSKESDGYYDVSVGPLTELWGFGLSKRKHIDTSMVDSVLRFVGFDSIYFNSERVKLPVGFKIDFNSIAQGYTVDLISELLEKRGVTNYMVEVGGEVRAKGKNSKDKIWRIGVDKPVDEIDEADRFQMIVDLKDASLASSGNYRKFWVDEETGVRYSHTLNPKTGFPSKNKLLGVSIVSSTAMDADAYSTYCMAIGVQKSIDLLNSKPELEGYLIYTDENNKWEIYQTEGFKKYITN